MRIALLFLLCLLIAACSQTGPSSNSATLFIVNNSDQQLCKVHLTNAEGDQLDVLLVNGDQPLESQANVHIKVAADAKFVISVKDCDGNFLEGVKGLEIPNEGLSYYVGGLN